MSEEFEEAKRLIDDLVGLEHFEVVPLPSRDPKVRLYGAIADRPLTIGWYPIVIADRRGVRYLEHRKLADAWIYAAEHREEPS